MKNQLIFLLFIITVSALLPTYTHAQTAYLCGSQDAIQVLGGYGYIRDYVNNLSTVKPSDIQKVAGEYLSPGKYLAMAAVPAQAEEEQ